MASTKEAFEDVFKIKVIKKLEDCFMRQIKVKECFTHMHQAFSLWSDKLFKSVEAAEKEKKSKLIQATAKLFWKKFVVASQPTKKLWISLERLSFQEQSYSKRVPREPDHSLWDIIVNGDFQEETAPTGDQSGPSAPPVPKTAKQLAAKRNHESWQVAMLTVRVQRFIKKTGRNLDFRGKQHVTFDKSQVECYNCHKKGHFAKECKSGWNQGKRSYGDNGRRNATTNEPSSQALVAQDGLENYDSEREKHSRARLEIQGYGLALESLESRILGHEKNELAWVKMMIPHYELNSIRIKITHLNMEIEKVVTEIYTIFNTNEVNVEKPKSVNESVVSTPNINKDKVIIEDWNSDDENDVSEVSPVKTNET
ncbi:ribonuclease H-like domain-containing protein [Tanacetum coccineum]